MIRAITFLLFSFSITYTSVCQTIKFRLSDHAANIEAVCYSPDGKLIASGSWDGSINLYGFDSTGSPVLKQTLRGHLSAVTSICISANGKYLVSSSKDYTSRIWNLDTPSIQKVYNLHLEPVTASFVDPSNKYLISASLDGTVRTTNVSDALKSKSFKPGGPVYDLQMSRDKKFFLAAIKGGLVKKFETGGSNNQILEFKGHTDEVNALDISPDGNFLATASSDKTIGIWDINSGKRIKTLSGFEWKVTSVKFSSDGRYIVGGCNNGVAKLFETESGKAVSDFAEAGKNVRDVAFSRDGKTILVASITDDAKFGPILYNSGVVAEPKTGGKSGGSKEGKSKGTPAPSGASASVNNKKSNGTK